MINHWAVLIDFNLYSLDTDTGGINGKIII